MLYKFETLQFFNVAGMTLGWAIIAALVLIGFSAFTLVVFRRTNDKAVTGSYAVMLLIATLFYGYVAYKAPKVQSKDRVKLLFITSLDFVNEEFHRQCTSMTGMSDYQMVDRLYSAANGVLCSSQCKCEASKQIKIIGWIAFCS